MLRHAISRLGALILFAAVLSLATLTTSCGGGGGYAAKPMVLLQFLFVDRALNPTAPTGTTNAPRNIELKAVMAEKVYAASVNTQSFQVRYGSGGQSVPKGSFAVDGNVILFDPTVTAQGQPNPFGFEPATQYSVYIPSIDESLDVIKNLDDDPCQSSFFTTFVTSDGYLRELVPPQVVRVYSIPDRFAVNPLTGQFPGNAVMAFEFNEPMDPSSFILGGANGPDSLTTIDVRYLSSEQINIDNGLVNGSGVGQKVAGYFTHDAADVTYFFTPTFSFGDKKYVFASQVFQGLKDLAGNLLVNPRTFGPYTCDGAGIETGVVLEEDFTSSGNIDFVNNEADWGTTEDGVLQGQPISSRDARIFGFSFQGDGATSDDFGQYAAFTSPLIGAALNQYVSGITPPTSDGRRVMWAFTDTEMGPDGAITSAGWGPDSNATFAAIYPGVTIRCGYQKNASLSLSPQFSGNYEGNPTILYTGEYRVNQKANVGNTVTNPTPYPNPYAGRPFVCSNNWNDPLFAYTGFVNWPSFNSFFEWDDGDAIIQGDKVFIFDVSSKEGDTWQQIRGWYGATYPCSGFLIPGFPYRRMYSTYEADSPDPASNGFSIQNPEPSVTDTVFTITKRVSNAQTLFYTDTGATSPSVQTTFGASSDYRPIQLTPSVQSGGAQVVVEYQGAQAVGPDRRTINTSQAYTGWTQNVNDCDGYKCIRWRIRMVSNLLTQTKARLYDVTLPVVNAD